MDDIKHRLHSKYSIRNYQYCVSSSLKAHETILIIKFSTIQAVTKPLTRFLCPSSLHIKSLRETVHCYRIALVSHNTLNLNCREINLVTWQLQRLITAYHFSISQVCIERTKTAGHYFITLCSPHAAPYRSPRKKDGCAFGSPAEHSRRHTVYGGFLP